jgi:hypothetical protein
MLGIEAKGGDVAAERIGSLWRQAAVGVGLHWAPQLPATQLGNARWVVCSLKYADDDAIDRLAVAFEDLAAKRPPPNKPIPVVPPL